jgi:hypothetical protein
MEKRASVEAPFFHPAGSIGPIVFQSTGGPALEDPVWCLPIDMKLD